MWSKNRPKTYIYIQPKRSTKIYASRPSTWRGLWVVVPLALDWTRNTTWDRRRQRNTHKKTYETWFLLSYMLFWMSLKACCMYRWRRFFTNFLCGVSRGAALAMYLPQTCRTKNKKVNMQPDGQSHVPDIVSHQSRIITPNKQECHFDDFGWS